MRSCRRTRVGLRRGRRPLWVPTRYLEGVPLSSRCGTALPLAEAVEIVLSLARALEYAHGKGVVHRDLEPSNVMLCEGVGPVLMDFGLAKQTTHPDDKLTRTGVMLGTPSYMPPEQIKGDLHLIGPASDVSSLGVILFELLTGRLPFGGTVAEMVGKALYVPAPAPSEHRSGIGRGVDAACLGGLAKTPGERFASMQAFAAALASGRDEQATAERLFREG